MKTFKVFIQILLVVIFLSLLMTVFASAQSDNKINRLSKETGLYVKTTMGESHAGVYSEQTVYCGEELVTHFINKRHFIAHTSKFELDLDVKKRGVGQHNSWLAVDKDKRYFYITPFRIRGIGNGVFIQPVDKNYNRLYDLPMITIANFNLCQ